jgi:hypothetical protein
MRRALSVAPALAMLLACAAPDVEHRSVLLASLKELAREFPSHKLCVNRRFSDRPFGDQEGWVYIEQPPPPGFEDLAKHPAKAGGPEILDLPEGLPQPWHVGDGAEELCFELTRPVIQGDRAGASAEVAGMRTGERRIYWLSRESGEWTVVHTTRGKWDI